MVQAHRKYLTPLVKQRASTTVSTEREKTLMPISLSSKSLSLGLTPVKSSLRLTDTHIRFSEESVGLTMYSPPTRVSLLMKYVAELTPKFNRYAPTSTCSVQWRPLTSSNLNLSEPKYSCWYTTPSLFSSTTKTLKEPRSVSVETHRKIVDVVLRATQSE
ncbi:MAG: hypothetical protein BWY21_00101 [Parcubacteria group bacterium ADurb.Bin216]|nr:MAG: hypothetical protein BWY21_00101 [Parcubacteria group bacterium ADurb.Bin216]